MLNRTLWSDKMKINDLALKFEDDHVWSAHRIREDLDGLESDIHDLAQDFDELRIAVLNTIPFIPGGEAKAKLLDAYDKATEQLEDI